MELPEKLKPKSVAELENWFLDALAAEPLPAEDLLNALEQWDPSADGARRRELAAWLEEALIERGDKFGLLRLLSLRSAWEDGGPEFRERCLQSLRRVFKERAEAVLLANAGFDSPAPARECLRRLSLLARLREGVLCRDKTWGFGIVRRVDDFYARVTIDFARKPNHALALTYAAEALELIGEDHLLARAYREPQALEALRREQPGEVVRLALRSYGPLNAAQIKEALVGVVLPEAEWKGFWDAARKELKADPLVEVPANRNAPLRLLEQAKSYDAAWFGRLGEEKDPERIAALAQEAERSGSAEALPQTWREIVGERLAFAIRGVQTANPALTVRLALLARRLGFREALPATRGAVVKVPEVLNDLLSGERLAQATAAMSAREIEKFLAALADFDRARLTERLLQLLPRLSLNALAEALRWLTAERREAEAAAVLNGLLGPRGASPVVLAWLCRNLDSFLAWGVGRLGDLLAQAMDAVAAPAGGEQLKAQKQLRELFQDRDWLEVALDSLDHGQREALVARLCGLNGWPEGDKRSALAAMIRVCPELSRVVAGRTEEEERPPARFTSWRSYRERQEQLRRLVEVTIPENSREIGVARSYGDLRENFEYQAAKDRQRLLLRRKRELEEDLAAVRGSDFQGLPCERAGMGTCVAFERPDGRVERVCILGEWDRDEPLNIIASRSKLALALAGHAAGESVLLPGAAGDELCRVLEVTGLTEEVRAWLNAPPPPAPAGAP